MKLLEKTCSYSLESTKKRLLNISQDNLSTVVVPKSKNKNKVFCFKEEFCLDVLALLFKTFNYKEDSEIGL